MHVNIRGVCCYRLSFHIWARQGIVTHLEFLFCGNLRCANHSATLRALHQAVYGIVDERRRPRGKQGRGRLGVPALAI